MLDAQDMSCQPSTLSADSEIEMISIVDLELISGFFDLSIDLIEYAVLGADPIRTSVWCNAAVFS